MKQPIIEFRHVSKVYEDTGTQVLKDINFELEEGKFYTLLGASGSGKSTILNMISRPWPFSPLSLPHSSTLELF